MKNLLKEKKIPRKKSSLTKYDIGGKNKQNWRKQKANVFVIVP